MKTQANILLKLSFLSGAIPFIGGWGIFFLWIITKYFTHENYRGFEFLGLDWIIICFFIALIGLSLLTIYRAINGGVWNKKVFYSYIAILINIPAVIIIIFLWGILQ